MIGGGGGGTPTRLTLTGKTGPSLTPSLTKGKFPNTAVVGAEIKLVVMTDGHRPGAWNQIEKKSLRTAIIRTGRPCRLSTLLVFHSICSFTREPSFCDESV